ncbi:MAG: hypothetical protein ACLFQL_02575 [Paracoccaceae bacterium]
MRVPGLLLCLMLVAACGRPLTETERAFAADIHGPALDASKVRLVRGAPVESYTWRRPVRPRTTCRERIWPERPAGRLETVTTGALVLFNHIFYRSDLYAPDYTPDYPARLYLAEAMMLAHELTHVWQWQNRARTGYHPLRAAREHLDSPDPYLFELETADFLDYGYEQQGAIVEEYVCCRMLDPEAPRTERLHDMLAAAFPVSQLDGRLSRAEVILPWDGAETRGICRG